MLSPPSKLEIVDRFGIIVDTCSEWDPSSGFIVNYWILRSLPLIYSFISFMASLWCHKVQFLPFLLCSLCFWLRNCLCSCLGRTMSRCLTCGLIWPWPLEFSGALCVACSPGNGQRWETSHLNPEAQACSLRVQPGFSALFCLAPLSDLGTGSNSFTFTVHQCRARQCSAHQRQVDLNSRADCSTDWVPGATATQRNMVPKTKTNKQNPEEVQL